MLEVILPLVLVGVSIAIYHVRKRPQEKILDVYTVPGQWFYLKYILLLCLMFLKDYLLELKQFITTENLEVNVEDLESFQELSDHEKGFNAVYIQATNNDGYYLSGGVERRHQGRANAVFYIVVPNLGLLRSENLPKTNVAFDSDSLYYMKSFGGGGINFAMVEPMRKWKISYRGRMWIDNLENWVDVVLDVEWRSSSPYFTFENLNKYAMARSIAREEWTHQLFKNFKESKSTHYEQMGVINGTLLVNGVKHDLQLMNSFRDHSFGYKRDWLSYHRYIYHVLFLDDKTIIAVGSICVPSSTTELEVGYVQTPELKIHTIEKCDLILYQHGENGTPPKEIAFTIWANERKYEIKIVCHRECFHYKGNDTEAKIFERFLICEVNGIKGRGFAQWQYNNVNNI